MSHSHKVTHRFRDDKLTKIINEIEDNDVARKDQMNFISNEIISLEKLLKKWNLQEFISVGVGCNKNKLIWCPDDKRFLFQIASGAKKPVIEQPFKIRKMLHEEGHITNFFDHILKNYL